ncbi:hypothetical protein [Brevibacillus sp. H7]|uniref:hypothetical protein n=1 Tax=Brevibacillus sp. H7 TaxID=3349138 RepID=UPI00381140B8
MWKKGFLVLLLLFGACSSAGAQRTDISGLKVDSTPATNLQDLVRRCDMIVFGWTDSAHQSYPTRERVPEGRKVNYVQSIHVKTALKGTAPRLVDLLSTGVEPLPDPENPLNMTFPGPLAEGDYLLFLQPVKGTSLHSIVGLWQGVYPVYEGKTIALRNAGFSELNDITVSQVQQKLKSLSP